MKKTIATLMLGSAILLSNNNNVEASYSKNEVQVQKALYVKYIELGDKTFNFYGSKSGDKFNNEYLFGWKNIIGELQKIAESAKAKPANPTPEAKPAPTKPAPTTPEAKPAPTKPAPSTPEAKPAPTKPAPSTPEVKPAPTTPAETTQDASVSAIEKEVLDLTNVERQKAGLAPLQTDSNLMNSARQKSTDMATNNYFSHTSPTHGSPFDQMKANGVSYKSAAENIAMGQRTAQEVVKGWMDSPGHKENILTPGYTHIGIGYDANGHYWTQQFIGK